MPNISGYFTNGKPLKNPDELLSKYKKLHTFNGLSYNHREFKSETCVVCNTLTGILETTADQPVSDPSGNTILFLEGEIYNTDELLSYLNADTGLSHCSILLALFLKLGPEFVTLLNGEFNIVIYQKAEKQLTIFNDHVGSKPFFYMENSSGLSFGSEKKSILAISEKLSQIDPVGLLQMFVHGHNLGERTFINGLRCLSPASYMEYRHGQLSIYRYSYLQFTGERSIRQSKFLLEEWCELLQKATTRRLNGKRRILINLSGGFDSRGIACAIPRDFRPIFARTKGNEDSQEFIYAKEIARRLNFTHYRENPKAEMPSDLLHKIVWRTECSANFLGCLSIANHLQMKKYADFLIGGMLGGTVKGYNYPRLFIPYSRQKFIDKVYDWDFQKSNGLLSQIFNPDFLRKHSPHLKSAFLSSFDCVESKSNKQLYETWGLYEYQTRGQLSTASVDTYMFEHIRPLIDKDHLNFILKLPTSLRYYQVLYQAMIYRLGPEIRSIPIANTNFRVKGSVLENNFNTVMSLGKKIYIKCLSKFGKASRYAYRPAGGSDLPHLVMEDLKLHSIVNNFVKSPSFDSSVFNSNGIVNLLEKHTSVNPQLSRYIGLLATFAVGIPYFVTNSPDSCPVEAQPLGKNNI